MAHFAMKTLFAFTLLSLSIVDAFWLTGSVDFITTERIDPIVNPGAVSGHVHSVFGGSNFRFNTTTEKLRASLCTSIPIKEDKSIYWFPHLYFQWSNGSFSSLTGGAVIYYLFDNNPGATTAFPDDFRMLSGSPTLRTYDSTSFAQQAVTFLCLDFNGVTTKYNNIPDKECPSGIRAQINFPSCWDGKNLDSTDHKSHVAFKSGGPDSGSCTDPKFPVTLPRIFMEVYWGSQDFDQFRSQAMTPNQPFVYSYGDRTGYGYHADFLNGWDSGVLQRAVDGCTCNDFGDTDGSVQPTCCAQKGIFTLKQNQNCYITKSVDEQTTGTLPKLPGNNPVQEAGTTALMFKDPVTPGIIAPVFAYTSGSPPGVGQVVTPAVTAGGSASTPVTPPVQSAPAGSSIPVGVPSPVTSSVASPTKGTPSGTAVPSSPVGGVPTSSPVGGVPTSSPVGSVPTSSPVGGVPTSSPVGGVPTALPSSVIVPPITVGTPSLPPSSVLLPPASSPTGKGASTVSQHTTTIMQSPSANPHPVDPVTTKPAAASSSIVRGTPVPMSSALPDHAPSSVVLAPAPGKTCTSKKHKGHASCGSCIGCY
ncbi:hypothetical protein BDQ12DRAFT_766806 [Crucibulum laeve]|uniref:DUF1996 domain-containing protein n=1 Tax=Crucibulum laeve TaxID=68775 RepID=A0A5C3LKQ2_9AGAR|nr:hypothetical protein BDQ12DRAFT_766806 [Crucibulum laeve]